MNARTQAAAGALGTALSDALLSVLRRRAAVAEARRARLATSAEAEARLAGAWAIVNDALSTSPLLPDADAARIYRLALSAVAALAAPSR